jgi:3',5'-nucleoside bisphosphate phosphatase
MYIDLQFHSTYSDGRMTPTKLVDFLAKNSIKVAALTDHNTVAGLDEFFIACKQKGIKPISGIELYVRYVGKRLNFLFYNFDKDNPAFHAFLRKTQIQRRRNVVKALKYWQDQGLEIDIEKILCKYNHYIPTNGITRAIRKSPKNRKFIEEQLETKNLHEWEVIKFLFKSKKRYFLDETHVNIHRLKDLHKKIGGQVILGHPGKKKVTGEDVIKMLKHKYIDGIEILSPHHGWDMISYYQHKLKGRKLIYTGGSDFHGFDSGISAPTKYSWDYFKIKSRLLPGVEKIID